MLILELTALLICDGRNRNETETTCWQRRTVSTDVRVDFSQIEGTTIRVMELKHTQTWISKSNCSANAQMLRPKPNKWSWFLWFKDEWNMTLKVARTSAEQQPEILSDSDSEQQEMKGWEKVGAMVRGWNTWTNSIGFNWFMLSLNTVHATTLSWS